MDNLGAFQDVVGSRLDCCGRGSNGSSPSNSRIIRTDGNVCSKDLSLVLASGNKWSTAVRDRIFASLEHSAWYGRDQHANVSGPSHHRLV